MVDSFRFCIFIELDDKFWFCDMFVWMECGAFIKIKWIFCARSYDNCNELDALNSLLSDEITFFNIDFDLDAFNFP